MISDWYNERFCILKEITEPDGYGNNKKETINGRAFMAGMAPAGQSKPQVAEQGATAAVYSIAFDPDTVLHIGQKIRRMRDGAVYEVLDESDDYTTPEQASIDMRHAEVKIRRVTIP